EGGGRVTDGEQRREEGGLRRELRFWEAVALSIAIMAPGAAMALNGTATAGLVGRAVPLVFVLATLGILFVSYAFIRLTSYFNHAGSVYALSGATLGPRRPGVLRAGPGVPALPAGSLQTSRDRRWPSRLRARRGAGWVRRVPSRRAYTM
ncbi:MAG: hypothetical protein M3N33_11390, partial [Actinomycetota bacterium]|nr:hypothetical protein [Actinomycetota bacterium]